MIDHPFLTRNEYARMVALFRALTAELKESARRAGVWPAFVALCGPELQRNPWQTMLYEPTTLREIDQSMRGQEDIYGRVQDIMDLCLERDASDTQETNVQACAIIAEGAGLYVPPESCVLMTAREREDAITRLAAGVPPGLQFPHASRALSSLARDRQRSRQDLLRTWILPESVLLVVETIDVPRPIQLGQRRLTNEEGMWAPMAPTDLPPQPFIAWFRQQMYTAATAILLDQPYPTPHVARRDALARPVTPLIETVNPRLASAHRTDDTLEFQQRLALLASVASPQEQHLLGLLCQGYSPAEAAEAMGVRRSTIYNLTAHLRRKATHS
jgi:DNA-binding CsgD family transcriptional regulator